MQQTMDELRKVKKEAEDATNDIDLKGAMVDRMTYEGNELKKAMKQIDWMLNHRNACSTPRSTDSSDAPPGNPKQSAASVRF